MTVRTMQTLRIFQKGFNYSQDGPGNRLVYHLQGCNMRCRWCANPEGMEYNSSPFLSTNSAFPKDILLTDIVREAKECRLMFFEGGGVTFTGGEPTLQWEALSVLLPMLRAEGIHTAIETNGTHPLLENLFPYINHLIMDIKQVDSEIHKEYTGIGNETILLNIKRAVDKGIRLHLRIPLIHHVNDSERDKENFIRFFRSLDVSFVTVEILPYHEYGKEKWEKCGLNYTMTDGFVTKEAVQRLEQEFQNIGVTVEQT